MIMASRTVFRHRTPQYKNSSQVPQARCENIWPAINAFTRIVVDDSWLLQMGFPQLNNMLTLFKAQEIMIQENSWLPWQSFHPYNVRIRPA